MSARITLDPATASPAPARRTRLLHRLGAALGTALTVAALAATTPVEAEAAPGGCHDIDVPVTSGLLSATMHGTLCTPAGVADAPLQVLLPGATYTSSYWAGVGIDAYSYTAAQNRAGVATLALDRIGTGRSSRPWSLLVTDTVQTDAVHQVITAARAGTLPGDDDHYTKVLLGGHSLGSMITELAAARHPGDVDAVILTGISHHISPLGTVQDLASTHPQVLEKAGGSLDPGYWTTAPGMRAKAFDAADDVDPAVVAADEAGKDVFGLGEVPGSLVGSLDPATTRAITVPVLLANGGRDTFACNGGACSNADALKASEQDDFALPLTTYVQPKSGHCLAIAADGDRFADFAASWTKRTLTGGHA